MWSVKMNDPKAIESLLDGMPDVLTTDEVAQLMRVDSSTVIRWSRDYGLRIIALGPRLKRVRLVDLRDFLLTSDEHDH